MDFPFLEPLNASRAHRGCKIFVVGIIESPKLYSLICLHTKCIPKLFAGNERSEVPEKGGDLRGGTVIGLSGLELPVEVSQCTYKVL
jgi:hypothetical protein